jgi:hypothetical protein
MPCDVLKQIKILRLHELILLGIDKGNHKNWPRLSKLIGKQVSVREVVLHVPNDPSFPDACDDEDENSDPDDGSDDEDTDDTERRKIERFQTMFKN